MSTSLPSIWIPESIARRPKVERHARLGRDRHRDGPLVVLQEEELGRLVAGRKDHGLVHVALAGRTVTEVGDDGLVGLGVAGRRRAVERDAHRVARRVQGLRTEHERVDVKVVVHRGIPATVRDPAEQAHDVDRIDAADDADRVLAIGREDMVLRTHREAGADLRRLLPEARNPQPHLALALEVRALPIEGPGENHHTVELVELRVGEPLDEGQVLRGRIALDESTLGGQQLQRRRGIGHGTQSNAGCWI